MILMRKWIPKGIQILEGIVGLPILENVNTAEGRRQRVSMTKKTDHTPFSQCDIPHGNTFQQRRSII